MKWSSETEDHEKQRLATLKIFKRSVVGEKSNTNKHLGLAVETEEEEEQDWRMMQLPNGSIWPCRQTKKEKQD